MLMHGIRRFCLEFWRDERGLTKIEIGLALTGISLLMLATVFALDQNRKTSEEVADTELESMFAPAAGGNGSFWDSDNGKPANTLEQGGNDLQGEHARKPSLLLKLREASKDKDDIN